jgi:hypothetical protein
LIDIIMSTREGKVIRCTEVDDRNAWDDTSHSMEPDRNYTTICTHVRWSVHLSALLIT